MKWVRVGKWDRHIGTYRAVATAGKWTVVPGGTLLPTSTTTNSETAEDDVGNGMGLQKGEGLIQLSYSEKPSKRKPEPLLVFSNFNFTQCVVFVSSPRLFEIANPDLLTLTEFAETWMFFRRLLHPTTHSKPRLFPLSWQASNCHLDFDFLRVLLLVATCSYLGRISRTLSTRSPFGLLILDRLVELGFMTC